MPRRIDTDLVRSMHPIGDVVTGFGVELRSCGRVLVGRCPFHDDNGRPNLHVYPSSASWYCYRCAVGGDVISFVMRATGLNFREAVAQLDGRATLRGRPRTHPVQRRLWFRSQRRDWDAPERACLAAAVELYHIRLLGEPAALTYLCDRGIEHVTTESHQLGYASGDELAHYLSWRRLPVQAALRVGLLGRDGTEFLNGRLVVPEIRDGQPIWLVGRTLADNDVRPKYLGLPGPKPLLGWEAAVSSSSVILVEGVFDWLTLVQWGFPALALVGTHVRPVVLHSLCSHFSRLYLALDADASGQDATAMIEGVLGPKVTRVQLPCGVRDIAELAGLQDGQGAFGEALREAQRTSFPLASAA